MNRGRIGEGEIRAGSADMEQQIKITIKIEISKGRRIIESLLHGAGKRGGVRVRSPAPWKTVKRWSGILGSSRLRG
jgi:hypothetical protein